MNTNSIETTLSRLLTIIVTLMSVCATTYAQSAWQSRPSGVTTILNSVTFTPDGTAFIVGDGGVILRSRDDGLTWERLNPGWSYDLSTIAFIDDEHGFGMSGPWVVQTSDGGTTWTNYPIMEDDIAQSHVVQILNGQDFVCAGLDRNGGNLDKGFIVRTTDGGQTWRDRSVGITTVITGVHFISAAVGVAVGVPGTIFRTIDSGATWTLIDSNAAVRYEDVCFADSLHGFVVGTTGTVEATSDGGLTWNRRDVGIDTWLFDVAFRNEREGIVVGPPGAISTTSDGGSTWHREESGSEAWLNGVGYGPSGTVIAVGRGGAILRRAGNVSSVGSVGAMENLSLSVSPNPVVGRGRICYETRKPGRVEVSVYGSDGSLVDRVRSGMENVGEQVIEWEGAERLPAGIYQLVVQSSDGFLSTKCIVLR